MARATAGSATLTAPPWYPPGLGNVARMEFCTVAVVGLGTMGAGIAEVFARAGLSVIGVEADPQAPLGCGYPRGPMRMLAEVGLDRAVDVLTNMCAAYGDASFAPLPLLAERAKAGVALDGQVR